jgi:hypothetical protein
MEKQNTQMSVNTTIVITERIHFIKNQLMHLLRKLFYIHIKTLKIVKNVL